MLRSGAWLAVAAVIAGSVLVLGSLVREAPSPVYAESNPPGVLINVPNVFEVYVAAGENLDVSLVKNQAGPGTAHGGVTVLRPAGGGPAIPQCVISNGSPVGQTCAFTDLTSTVPGIWQVRFDTAGGNLATDPIRWTINAQAGTVTQPGRVLSPVLGGAIEPAIKDAVRRDYPACPDAALCVFFAPGFWRVGIRSGAIGAD